MENHPTNFNLHENRVSGADLLAASLKAAGVSFVFMEDHAETAPIATAIKNAGGLRLINPVSEICCVPMADACARYTGSPVASITAGGGHCANQIMGITTAWGDKSPVLSIGINRDEEPSLSPVFDRRQVPMEEVFAPVTVYQATVRKLSEMDGIIARATRESRNAKGGPVHIQIPARLLDATQESMPTADAAPGETIFHSRRQAPPVADPALIQKAVTLLLSARRPFIFAGGGVIQSGAAELVNNLAKKASIPLLSSMGALDLVAPDNPMRMGPSSYLSGEAFHHAIKNADVVLAIGVCFSGLDGFGLPPLWSDRIRFIQINIDPQYIALNPPADIAIVADARQAIIQIMERLDTVSEHPDWSNWLAGLQRRSRRHEQRLIKEARAHKNTPGRLHPAAALLAVREHVEKADLIAVVDGGNTPLWAGMTMKLPGPGRVFFPTGMATLGVGIPMALGFKAAAPEKPVVLFSGDGSLLYNIQELELVKKYDLPLTIIVNNDSAWNMIRSGEVMLNKTVSTDLPPQDYTAVARAFGMEVVRIRTTADITPALMDRALRPDQPLLIDIPTDKDVFPDALVSFIRVEMMGVLMPQPWKKTRRLYQSQARLFSRNTWNIIKYLVKTF